MNSARILRMLGIVMGLAASARSAEPSDSDAGAPTEAGSPTAPYLVIDLKPRRIAVSEQSGGETIPRTMVGFVVSNLAAVPPGGWTEEYKTTKLVLRRIPAGTFMMGSPADEMGREADETQHSVTITKDFYIGVFEVTHKQWELVTGKGVPGHTRCDLSVRGFREERNIPELNCRPVEMITFYEIRENPVTDDATARAILAKRAPTPESKPAAVTPAEAETTNPLGGVDDPSGSMDDAIAVRQKAEEQNEKAKKAEDNALQEIMKTPSHDPAADWPANSGVNPDSFFGKLRTKTMLAGLDLPTEAQWEYACRAGTTTALNSGKNLTQWNQCPYMAELGRYVDNHDASEWFWSKRWERLCSAMVGSYAPNKWGLYDMHGNVWEWCLDWYAPLSSTAATDPKGPTSGQARVVRGGGWDDRAKACRSANRGPAGFPSSATPCFGFRVVLTLP